MKKKNFKVSIIINCHNGEKFLKECITSILSQKYKNWEIIFWDNCSVDNSKYIFNKYRDYRFKYFKSKKLLNLYKARNLAIKKAKGDYVCFLDVDDWWSKNKLFDQIKFFEKNQNIKCIYSNYFIYNEKQKKKKLFSEAPLPNGKITQDILNNFSIGILTVMIEKNLLLKVKFNSRYNIIGDFDFFVRLSKKNEIKCIQKPLAYYRFHGLNYSNLKLNEYRKELSYFLNKIKNDKIYNKYSFTNILNLKFKLFLKSLINFF